MRESPPIRARVRIGDSHSLWMRCPRLNTICSTWTFEQDVGKSGGSTQSFGGALYLSTADVTFAGGADTTVSGCTQLIADTISFSGASNFALNCDGSGIKPLGSAATLLE